MALGRRLTEVAVLTFTILMHHIFKSSVAPFALVVQNQALEPWVIGPRQRQYKQSLKGLCALLFWSRELLRVLVLLKQHLTDADMRAFLFTLLFATPGKLFPVAVAEDDPTQ